MDLESARRQLNVTISMAMRDHEVPYSAVAPHQLRQRPFNVQAFINIMKMPAEDMRQGWNATRDAIASMTEAFKVLPAPPEDLGMAGKFCHDFLDSSRNDELDSTRKIATQLHLLTQYITGNSLSSYTTNLLATKALVKLTSDFLFDHIFNKSESQTIITMAIEVCSLRCENASLQTTVLGDVAMEITEAFRLGRFLLDVEEAGASFLLHPALHINNLRGMPLARQQYITDLLDAIGAVHQSDGGRNTAVNSMLDALVAHFHPSDVNLMREFNFLVKDINPVIGGTRVGAIHNIHLHRDLY
ncbi:hypothetical protein B0H19DRAFT_1253818 [Mycena capillaripes]|nr:hypothetical protein B0H19DRAFT_1253818 [Mycena capillaripes]